MDIVSSVGSRSSQARRRWPESSSPEALDCDRFQIADLATIRPQNNNLFLTFKGSGHLIPLLEFQFKGI